ncbi:hypothetical protein RJT34_17675 [Clitoria ternatea]|uniref:Uncharacterized protein n=1 Tax=Clitoria ternatea TaxID=43366 RepID=A0AAN9JAN1_CLITE
MHNSLHRRYLRSSDPHSCCPLDSFEKKSLIVQSCSLFNAMTLIQLSNSISIQRIEGRKSPTTNTIDLKK